MRAESAILTFAVTAEKIIDNNNSYIIMITK